MTSQAQTAGAVGSAGARHSLVRAPEVEAA
jgi:hypothetical protein